MLLMHPLLLLLALSATALCRAIDREDLLLMTSDNVRTGTLPPVATAMITPKVITIDDGYSQIPWPFSTTTITLCFPALDLPTPEPEPDERSTVALVPVRSYSSAFVPLPTPGSVSTSSTESSTTSSPITTSTRIPLSHSNPTSMVVPEPTAHNISSSITTLTTPRSEVFSISSEPSETTSPTSLAEITTSVNSTSLSFSVSTMTTKTASPSPAQSTQPANSTKLQPYCAVYHENSIAQIQGPALKYVVSPIDTRWSGLTFLDKLSNCGDTFDHVYRDTQSQQYPGHHVEFYIKQPTADEAYAKQMQCVQRQIKDAGGPHVWCVEWNHARPQMCDNKARGYKPYLGCNDEQQYSDLMKLP